MATNRKKMIEVSGGTLVLAPLPLKLLQEYEADIVLITSRDSRNGFLSKEKIDAFVRVITASARLVDPDVTEEKVSMMIDTSDLPEVIPVLFNSTGLRQRATVTSLPNGKVGEAVPTSPQTGGDSTDESLQPPAGPSGRSMN
jgi:hypothetical protein